MAHPATTNGRSTRRSRSAKANAAPDTLDLDQLLSVLVAVRKGDFSVRMPASKTGLAGKIADTVNDIVDLNQNTAQEIERVSQAVGKEGRITQRANLAGAVGQWAASVSSVNSLIADLVQPTSEVARVIGAVAKGDLSQTMALDIEGRPLMGEFLRIGRTVNSMVDQLSSFASEVTRVAREVGTEGKLGGQAIVPGLAGTV
jgi:methyl-accepting chemotaxis protein